MKSLSICGLIIASLLVHQANAADIPTLDDVALTYEAPAPSVVTVAQGLKHAKENDGYLLVFVYGSTWSQRSVPVYQDLWPSAELRKNLGPGVAMFAADLPEAPSAEEQKRYEDTLNGIKLNYRTVPAVLLYDKLGQPITQSAGRILEHDPKQAIQAINAMVRQARLRDLCLTYADEHKASNPFAAAEALAVVSRMAIDKPIDLVERIKALDPEDRSGWIDAVMLTDYNIILEQIVEPMIVAAVPDDDKQADDKASQEKPIDASLAEQIISVLRKRMDNPRLTSEQQMHMLIAIGTTYKRADMQAPMIQAYKQAMEKQPDHWAGRAHYQHAIRSSP